MPRVKRGVTARARHKKVFALSKGFSLRRNNVYRVAKQAVIARINAGSLPIGMTFSVFMNGLKKAGIGLDRKVLSDMAIFDKEGFASLVNQVKGA